MSLRKFSNFVHMAGPTNICFRRACDSAYIKRKSVIFARHELATRKQNDDEDLDQFLHELKYLASCCDFQSVTAVQYQDEYTRDAFINGMKNPYIRQRLLESQNLDLSAAYELARSLELAERQSRAYNAKSEYQNASSAAAVDSQDSPLNRDPFASAAVSFKQTQFKCYWCGGTKHSRRFCPAKDDLCKKCHTPGHWARVCRGGRRIHPTSSSDGTTASLQLCHLSATAPSCLKVSLIKVYIQGKEMEALIDTGSSHSFIKASVATELQLCMKNSTETVSLASSKCKIQVRGHVLTDISLQGETYYGVRFGVIDNLCADVLIGVDFMVHNKLQTIILGSDSAGKETRLELLLANCNNVLAYSKSAHNSDSRLFHYLKPGCKPIAIKSRNYSYEDRQFIIDEVDRLLRNGIIEPSKSPWRAQVIVTREGRHKRRMVIDYSRTINIYTELDAYPLPRIDTMVNELSKYSYFSTLDLEDAYYQEEIPECDRPYTAFEANGRLFQFTKIPFGVTNGVSAFQRRVDHFIASNKLQDTFAYVDNWTVCGKTREEHDLNLSRLRDAATRHGYKFNQKKCVYAVKEISLLGYTVSQGEIRPDADRLKPLQELPVPRDLPSLRRAVGLFSYYSQWVSNFSQRIHPLVHNKSFPMDDQAESAFEELKKEIGKSTLYHIDEDKPFVIESDASDHAIAATLNQCGRPLAFFSRSLRLCEQKHASVEKEALAIVEAVRKWRHFLYNKHFTLITDQRSVSFMFDTSKRSKIKNDKIERWRLELACFSYDIVYRAGKLNIPSDALSRIVCSSTFAVNRVISSTACASLFEYHDKMCHPGVTRLFHFVRSRNLPFSIEDVKRVCRDCRVCCKIKPRYLKRPKTVLVKATQPWERISIDFKGPIPSSTPNKFMLTVVDEYSRFPFAFPCKQTDAKTVINCLSRLFSVFGMPMFVHSDRGSGFVSQVTRNWLHSQGVATSNSSPFHPTGNSQVERFNGVIWRSVQLALESRGLPISSWESVLTECLHAIRSLLCTATNCSPHERMFHHQRRGSSGSTLPAWLCSPGKVLLRRHVRSSKYDPSMTTVDLIEANPQYATIRTADGRETTVSTQDLAPTGKLQAGDLEPVTLVDSTQPATDSIDAGPSTSPNVVAPNEEANDLRRSQRISRPPNRLAYDAQFQINEGRMS